MLEAKYTVTMSQKVCTCTEKYMNGGFVYYSFRFIEASDIL